MPRLDLLDRVSAGHLGHSSTPESSPERAHANINSLDSQGNEYQNHPTTRAPDLPHRQSPQNAAPIPENFPPPAYRLTPHQKTRTPRSRNCGPPLWKGLLHWLRLVHRDIAFMLLALNVVYIIMKYSHVVFRWNQRYFPMTWDPVSERWYGPPELSYPQSPFILSILFTGVVIPAVGVAVVVGMQVWVRSFWDANAGLFALFKGLVMMTFIQIFLKQWIGEFRPFFITVCDPVLTPPNMTDPTPFRRLITPAYCKHQSGPSKYPLLFAMQSFPSGHTSEAFFVGTFLALYLYAKLKAFSDYHTSFWKWLVVMFPLFGSCLIAGTLIVDTNHHVHDILLSIPLGVLVAFLAYRSHYASVFNYRTNHLPLPWSGSSQSLHPTMPAPETEHGDNLTAVTWPRNPVEHSFDGRRERGVGFGPDGAPDRSRRPQNITRARLRQNIFPRPTPLTQTATGSVVPDGQGGFELREVMETDGVEQIISAARPSTARATGHQMDMEGQRQRRGTLDSSGGTV